MEEMDGVTASDKTPAELESFQRIEMEADGTIPELPNNEPLELEAHPWKPSSMLTDAARTAP